MNQNNDSCPGTPSADEAKVILAEFIPILKDAFEQSWSFVEQILEEDPERRATFSASLRAGMVYERMAMMLRQAFDGHPRMQVMHRGRMLRLIVDGRLVLRFKKLNRNLMPSNVHTESQRRDYNQHPEFPFMEQSALTTLTFGYRLDEIGANVLGTYITRTENWSTNRWVIPLDDDASGTMPLFAPQSQPDTGRDAGIIVTPRRRPAKNG